LIANILLTHTKNIIVLKGLDEKVNLINLDFTALLASYKNIKNTIIPNL